MRNIVIIGGGLSGLAAAVECERRGVAYTLIEVKPRLGGSLHSVQGSGFILDSVPMFQPIRDADWLRAMCAALGVEGLVFEGERVLFTQGVESLVAALAARVTSPVMYRMAVSTLGRMDAQRFSICMENGMLLDARALIVASPARHAERMFHTLTPEISYRLLDYRYDTITHIAMGYPMQADVSTVLPEDYPLTYIQQTRQPERVPEGGLLLQTGLRVAPHDVPQDPVGEIAALMDWPLNPAVDHIATWTESDPVMWRDPNHTQNMHAIHHLLPERVALIGSDYIPTAEPPRLDERWRQGIAAVERVLG
ncbi:MAG: hypothetical protein OHK0046_19110 [Anaerolineae bacterium]